MKFIVALVLTALLGFAAPLFIAWWSFAVTSLVVALAIHQKPWKAFLAGFLGLFLLWGSYAFFLDNANGHLLSLKISQLLNMGKSSIILILLTAFIGGLVSGFAALTGSFARMKK